MVELLHCCTVSSFRFTTHRSPLTVVYSLLKLLTGLLSAALIACQLTVNKQMVKLNIIVNINTQALSDVW